MNSTPRVFLISLGCAKNLVDSENILGVLQSLGYHPAPELESARIAVINTCGFIQSAVEEAIDTILQVAELKKAGKLEKLIVVGCFVQRYGRKLPAEMPEVDGWLGTGEIQRIAEILLNNKKAGKAPLLIGRPEFLADHETPRTQTTPFYSAFLKIAEGCAHSCSYCVVPHLRGPLRSRRLSSLLAEAEAMAGRGVKEINLVAQDTTQYGKDLEQEVIGLEDLLEALLGIRGLSWIRVLYCHPGGISERLLELMESEEAICPYIDLPLQHIDKQILRAMGRGGGKDDLRALIESIRSRKRHISLRTTFMVGFPGETEAMFRELCDFVRQAEFEHLGAFVFSPESGTRAARLKKTVERQVAQQRLDELMTLQAGIAKEHNRKLVGRTLPVLIEGSSRETDLLLNGRTAAMAPEVDGQVLINEGEALIGEIMPITIREAHSYDLVGKVEDERR